MDAVRTGAELLPDGELTDKATFTGVSKGTQEQSIPTLRTSEAGVSMRFAPPVKSSSTSMDSLKVSQPSIAFGPYEADLHSGELRKNGTRIKIQDLPLRLLSVLAENAGQVVTRDELQKRLWPEDTFVDFEDGLNTAVKKLREALGDDAEKPRFIETVPRRGYRFVAEVKQISPPARPFVPTADAASPEASRESSAATGGRTSRWKTWVAGAAAVLVALSGLGFWLLYGRAAFSFSARDSVLVSDFENQTGDPRFDEALRAAFTVSLAQSRHANIFPRARVGSVLQMMGKPQTERITPTVGREICQRENIRGLVTGSITRTGQEYALSAELIDPQTGETVRSYMERSYGEDHVLDALDVIAADVRRDLGESLYQIHRSDRTLPQVTTSSLTALKQYADGSTLLHQGKYKEAVTLLRAAVQSDPDFAMAHAALGSNYFSYIANAPVQGKEEYEKALALSSRTTDRERLIIQTSYAADLEHIVDADVLYRAYLSQYPDDWAMLSDYALLLRRHGRAPEAITQYKEILRVAPDDAKTFIEMATAYRTMNESAEALSAYAEGFRLDPHWLTAGDTAREYGFLLIQNGEDKKAEQIFSGMLDKPETRESGTRSLALLDTYHGRFASARKRFDECLTILQNQQAPLSKARVHLWLAILADGEGDLRGERRELDDSFANFEALGPKVVLGAWLGRQYVRGGALDKAEKIESLIAPLTDTKSAEQRGYLQLLQGEIALAQGHADKAIEMFNLSNTENSTAFSVEALARAYQEAGKTDDAISWYEKFLSIPNRAISWEPQQPWLAAHCALAADYLAKGEREKAKQLIDQILLLWKDADPDLKLRKQMQDLQARVLQAPSNSI
jgi:DNA-binding winged helix-turn-helix (wHTH) protein/tetratricopeptide (TPR) repeat protein